MASPAKSVDINMTRSIKNTMVFWIFLLDIQPKSSYTFFSYFTCLPLLRQATFCRYASRRFLLFSRICLNENAFLRGEKVIKGIDHIGVAVKSIEGSLPFYEKVLGLSLLKIEEVEEQGVKVAFIQCGNVKIELLEPLFEDSAVGAFIKKRGEGLHHVALGVRTIEERINELKEKGVQMIDDVPRKGAGEASIAFLHPKSANGVLYELCEKTQEEEKKHG